MTTIGELFKDARTSRKRGLREAARMLEVSPSWLSKVERGLEKPGAEIVKRMHAMFEPAARPQAPCREPSSWL